MSDTPVQDMAAKAKQAILDGRGGEARALIDQMVGFHEEILSKERTTHNKAVDFLMDRHADMINALLGVERGIPLFSPDDEIKLATAFRRLAAPATRGKTLIEVINLPEDFDVVAEERKACLDICKAVQKDYRRNDACGYCDDAAAGECARRIEERGK